MPIELLKYSISTTPYNTPQEIVSNCNSITFYNAGTTTMVIDGVQYPPTYQLPITGNFGEICIQNFALSFTGAGVNSCVVYRKKYN